MCMCLSVNVNVQFTLRARHCRNALARIACGFGCCEALTLAFKIFSSLFSRPFQHYTGICVCMRATRS